MQARFLKIREQKLLVNKILHGNMCCCEKAIHDFERKDSCHIKNGAQKSRFFIPQNFDPVS
jgi:hypothetical protein